MAPDKPARRTVRYNESRLQRDLLTHPAILRLKDRSHGKQVGTGDAHDFSMVDADDRLHAEHLINAQTGRAVADLRGRFEERRQGPERDRRRAVADGEGVREQIAALTENAGPAGGAADPEKHHGIGAFGYALVLIALYLLTLPADVEAAQGSPLPPAGQWLLALGIGAAMVSSAHLTAISIVALHQAWQNRKGDGFLWVERGIELVALLSLTVAAIITVALWRADGLAIIARETGGVVQGSGMNTALAVIALLAFAASVVAGVEFRRGRSAAEQQSARAKAKKQLDALKEAGRCAVQAEQDAVAALESLRAQQESREAALHAWAGERKANVRQRAAAVELAERRRYALKGGPPRVVARRSGSSRPHPIQPSSLSPNGRASA